MCGYWQALQALINFQLAHGGQVIRPHLVHRATQVPHGHQMPRVKLHIGVRSVFNRHVGPVFARRVFDALPQCTTCIDFFLQAVSCHPAVLVGDLATFKTYRMQHAVPVKPVVTAWGFKAAVWSVAHIHAGQVFGDLALNVGELYCQLVRDRRKAA